MKRFSISVGLSLILFSLLFFSNCSKKSTNSGGGGNPPPNTIFIQNFNWNPSSLPVARGTTVTWRNNDGVPHTVTSTSGTELNSGSIGPGGSFQHTFNTSGTFPYHCTIHPSMPTAQVVVNP